jgi:ATP-dependent Zn protease
MRAIVDGQHERATKLLSEHRAVLDNMTRVLIEKETIYTEEVEMLLAGKTYQEVIDYMDSLDNVAEKAYKRME